MILCNVISTNIDFAYCHVIFIISYELYIFLKTHVVRLFLFFRHFWKKILCKNGKTIASSFICGMGLVLILHLFQPKCNTKAFQKLWIYELSEILTALDSMEARRLVWIMLQRRIVRLPKFTEIYQFEIEYKINTVNVFIRPTILMKMLLK